MRRALPSRRDDQGVVALEFLIVLPVLLMLIIGTVVLGNFFSLKNQAIGFAREGAREAALRQPLPAGVTIIDDPGVPNDGGACPNPTDPTRAVTVQVTRDVNLRSFPLMPVDILPETITETVTMRCGG